VCVCVCVYVYTCTCSNGNEIRYKNNFELALGHTNISRKETYLLSLELREMFIYLFIQHISSEHYFSNLARHLK
jgi:hypothetical protein